jgi:hypothetical protein
MLVLQIICNLPALIILIMLFVAWRNMRIKGEAIKKMNSPKNAVPWTLAHPELFLAIKDVSILSDTMFTQEGTTSFVVDGYGPSGNLIEVEVRRPVDGKAAATSINELREEIKRLNTLLQTTDH